MEELDLSSYYMSIMAIGVASVAFLVAVFTYLLHRKRDRQTITNGDLLNEVKKLFQTLESKLQTLGATERVLNEVKAMRQDLEAKYEKRDTTSSVSDEVEKLRREIELRFSIRFDKEAFTENDLFSFLFTVSQALYRFDRDTRSREGDENLRTEARGYIAILRLAMAWARANGNEMVRKKVTEILPRAEAASRRMNEL